MVFDKLRSDRMIDASCRPPLAFLVANGLSESEIVAVQDRQNLSVKSTTFARGPKSSHRGRSQLDSFSLNATWFPRQEVERVSEA